MLNLNEEDEEVKPWFRGADGHWRCLGGAFLSVAATVGLALWRNRNLHQQKAQLQKELEKNQLIIEDKDGTRKYRVCHSLFIREPFVEQTPDDKKPKQVERVFFNDGMGKAHLKINKLEDLLEERQHIFCSRFKGRSQRLRLEEQIQDQCRGGWLGGGYKAELDEILKSDCSCGNWLSFLWSGDKRKNGREMWKLLQDMRLTVIKEVEKDNSLITFCSPHSEEEKSTK